MALAELEVNTWNCKEYGGYVKSCSVTKDEDLFSFCAPESVWIQPLRGFPLLTLPWPDPPPLWRVYQQGAADAAGGLSRSHSASPAPTPGRDGRASQTHQAPQLGQTRVTGTEVLLSCSHFSQLIHMFPVYTDGWFTFILNEENTCTTEIEPYSNNNKYNMLQLILS